jgi:DNA-binding NarL/FixJ family response regulator
MMTVDSKRRIVAANCATRLLLRLSLAEMRERHLNDFTPPHMQRLLEEACLGLVHRGSVAGHGAISLLDASQLRIVYCAIANALPGQHVIVFMPANWPENELGVIEESPIPASSAPLSPREREVLTMISAGADLRQVSDELS